MKTKTRGYKPFNASLLGGALGKLAMFLLGFFGVLALRILLGF